MPSWHSAQLFARTLFIAAFNQQLVPQLDRLDNTRN